MLNLASFVSGSGSNMKAIHKAIHENRLRASLRLIVSSKAGVPALGYASENGIPVFVEPQKNELTDEYPQHLLDVLHSHGVDFIALCGYLRLLPSQIVASYRHRITNIHPALLPAFGGKGMYGQRVHQAVLDSGARVTGVTIHLVDEIYDHGLIVAQKCVEVLDGDTAESLSQRVLQLEHQMYASTLQLFAENRIHIDEQTHRLSIRETSL